MDFGVVYLASNLGGKDGPSLSSGNSYSDFDIRGGLVSFSQLPNAMAFNIPDAGNFLFGAASFRMNIGLFELQKGAQLNEGGSDTKADQRAIYMGYRYGALLKQIHYKSFFFPSFNDYEMEKPSFYKSTLF